MMWAPTPGRLETARLELRPPDAADALVVRRLWTERDPRVPPHRRIDAAGHPTLDEVASHLFDEPALLTVVRADTGAVIGYCGLITGRGNGSADEPELAYELLRSAQGRGYATEAAEAVVDWAARASYRALWAGVREWNTASRRVLEKLGFRETGAVDRDPVHGDSLLTRRDL